MARKLRKLRSCRFRREDRGVRPRRRVGDEWKERIDKECVRVIDGAKDRWGS